MRALTNNWRAHTTMYEFKVCLIEEMKLTWKETEF